MTATKTRKLCSLKTWMFPSVGTPISSLLSCRSDAVRYSLDQHRLEPAISSPAVPVVLHQYSPAVKTALLACTQSSRAIMILLHMHHASHTRSQIPDLTIPQMYHLKPLCLFSFFFFFPRKPDYVTYITRYRINLNWTKDFLTCCHCKANDLSIDKTQTQLPWMPHMFF